MMKHLFFLFFTTLLSLQMFGQCPVGNAFGTENTPPTSSTDCDGNVFNESISTGMWAGEYNTVNNLIIGETFCFSTVNGAGDFVTIYDDLAGTPLAFGPADGSVCIGTTLTSTLYFEVNLNDGACGTENIARESFINCSTCPAAVCGCNDATACNFDANANFNDGSCEFPLAGCNCGDALGCTDAIAANYNPDANCDDGSCVYSVGCGGLFSDPGGPGGDYPTGISETTAICPDNDAEIVTLTFTSFAVEARTTGGCWDDLQVWEDNDGNSAVNDGDTQFAGGQADDGGFCGTIADLPNGGVFNSNTPGNCLILVFFSDASVPQAGWTADITCSAPSLGCTDPCDTNYDATATTNDAAACSGVNICGCTDPVASNYDDSVTVDDGSCEYNASCGGLFADSGGPTGNYGSNEQDTTTICPDIAGEVVSVNFTSFSSENGFDEMLIFDGANTDAPAILTPGGSNEWEWDLNDTPPGGTADPVANSPFISSDASGCLTFVWNSDGSVVREGWTADITCLSSSLGCTDPCDTSYDATATTNDPTACSGVSICGCTNPVASNYDASFTVDDGSCEYNASCGGLFADSGGPTGNYGINEQDTTTICPDVAGEVVSVNFTSFSSENGFDELLIFDGANTDAAAILTPDGSNEWEWDLNDTPPGGTADPVANSPFVSSDASGCLTFVWNSDGSVVREGWTADVTCLSSSLGCTDPCDTSYDATATTNDPAACSGVSTCGCTDPTACNYDASFVTDDGSCEYPLTDCTCDDALGCTDMMSSNFDANAVCDDGSCEYDGACGGLSADIGGLDGDYPLSTSDTTAICPDNPAEIVTLTFTSFAVEPRTDGCWDDLQIWEDNDGDSAVSDGDTQFAGGQAVAGGFCGTIEDLPNGGVFNSSTPGNCLVLAFFSDTAVPQAGWTAEVNCSAPSLGCTDPCDTNYDDTATGNDPAACSGVNNCGCIDPLASNYDANVAVDDGSCEYAGFCGGLSADPGGLGDYPTGISDTTAICPDDASEIITLTFTSFAVEANTTGGCWDDIQIWEDTNGDQTISDGDTQFEGGQDINTGGYCGTLEDLPNGGVFNASGAGNCIVLAFFSDASVPQAGWTADVSCATASSIPGCTNPNACNYNSAATDDDGSCATLDCAGDCGGTAVPGSICDVATGTTYDADCDCTLPVMTAGCTDPTACNYNENATVDNGLCEYLDCEGNCGGTATVDECGDCGGTGAATWYEDTDGDGLGNPESTIVSCSQPAGYASNGSDTDDSVFNGGAACSLNVLASVICDTEQPGIYDIIITWSTTASNPQISITDNMAGTTLVPTNQSQGSLLFGPFNEPNGYSFTVADAGSPDCSITQSLSAVSCNVTAIELVEFDGRAIPQGNLIYWTTASEYSSDFFTVERSIDGLNFEAIGKVQSTGNGNTAADYEYLDLEPMPSAYYRLTETDQTGAVKVVSNNIHLERQDYSFELLTVSPIPTADFINVEFNSSVEDQITIQIFNAAGQLVIERYVEANIGYNKSRIDLSKESAGIYFLNLISVEQGSQRISIIKR